MTFATQSGFTYRAKDNSVMSYYYINVLTVLYTFSMICEATKLETLKNYRAKIRIPKWISAGPKQNEILNSIRCKCLVSKPVYNGREHCYWNLVLNWNMFDASKKGRTKIWTTKIGSGQKWFSRFTPVYPARMKYFLSWHAILKNEQFQTVKLLLNKKKSFFAPRCVHDYCNNDPVDARDVFKIKIQLPRIVSKNSDVERRWALITIPETYIAQCL